MKLRKVQKDKGLYLDIIESYRKDGKPTVKTIKTIGYLEKSGHDLAYWEDLVKNMNERRRIEKKLDLTIDMNEILDKEDDILNVGYFALKYIYNELGLNNLMIDIKKRKKISYSLNKNMELLVFSRILYPSSKRSTYEDRHRLLSSWCLYR